MSRRRFAHAQAEKWCDGSYIEPVASEDERLGRSRRQCFECHCCFMCSGEDTRGVDCKVVGERFHRQREGIFWIVECSRAGFVAFF